VHTPFVHDPAFTVPADGTTVMSLGTALVTVLPNTSLTTTVIFVWVVTGIDAAALAVVLTGSGITTTRRLMTTEAGLEFYQRVAAILGESREAEERVAGGDRICPVSPRS